MSGNGSSTEWQSIVMSMGFLIDGLIKEVALCHERDEYAQLILGNALRQQMKKVLPLEAGGIFDCLDKVCGSYASHYVQNLHKIILRVRSEVREVTNVKTSAICEDNSAETAEDTTNSWTDADFALHSGRFLRDYHVLSCLGEGAYGQVFKVRHLLDGAMYAVKKVMFRYHAASALERVQREARILARLKHENIVRYHVSWLEEPPVLEREAFVKREGCEDQVNHFDSVGERSSSDASSPESSDAVEAVFSEAVDRTESLLSNGKAETSPQILCLFMQMEICSSTLAAYLQERDRCGQAVDLKFNANVIKQAASGLASFHGLGLVHRDVKPSNIFMVGDVVKIGDFGVAKELGTSFGKEAGCSLVSLKKIKLLDLSSDEEEEEDGEENKDGFVRGSEAAVNSGDAGTPVYADPEQLKGKSCSAKSDIYSLGLVTLEMYLPCATQMEKAKVFEQLRLSRSFPQRAKFPEGVGDSILKMTDKHSKMRPSAREVEDMFSSESLLSLRSSGSSRCSSISSKF